MRILVFNHNDPDLTDLKASAILQDWDHIIDWAKAKKYQEEKAKVAKEAHKDLAEMVAPLKPFPSENQEIRPARPAIQFNNDFVYWLKSFSDIYGLDKTFPETDLPLLYNMYREGYNIGKAVEEYNRIKGPAKPINLQQMESDMVSINNEPIRDMVSLNLCRLDGSGIVITKGGKHHAKESINIAYKEARDLVEDLMSKVFKQGVENFEVSIETTFIPAANPNWVKPKLNSPKAKLKKPYHEDDEDEDD